MSGGATIRARPAVRPRGGGVSGDATPVTVLNDDHNTFEGVAAALARVLPGVSYVDGMAMAERIHVEGRCCVWSGQREVAELYWEQLAASGLTMAPLG